MNKPTNRITRALGERPRLGRITSAQQGGKTGWGEITEPGITAEPQPHSTRRLVATTTHSCDAFAWDWSVVRVTEALGMLGVAQTRQKATERHSTGRDLTDADTNVTGITLCGVQAVGGV